MLFFKYTSESGSLDPAKGNWRKIPVKIFLLIVFLSLCIPECVFSSSETAGYRHNEEGLNRLKAGDYAGAIVELKIAYQYLPSNEKIRKNLSIAYNNYGFYLMQRGDLNRAIQLFENALYYDPERPFILYNLGQAYYRTQNMTKAKFFLEKAEKLKPDIKGLQDLLRKVRGETKVEKNFELNETMHFIIASAPDLPVEKTSYIRTYLEEAYGRIGAFLDYYPEDKVVVVLFSEANYDRMLKNMPHWTLGVFDGKVRIPVNKFKYTDEEVIKIIYHEYAHAVVYNITKGKCPLWLNEGIASRAENFAKPKNRDLIKRHIEETGIIPFRKMPGDFTRSKNRKVATLLYVESYLLVEYIVKKVGYSGLRNILDLLARGAGVEYAIAKVLGESPDQFEANWIRFIMEQYGVSKI